MSNIRSRPGGFTTDTSRMGILARTRRIWDYRSILRLLIGRDLKVRYAGSALGYVWSILDPLLMSLVYWFVFTRIFTRSVGYDPYIVFLLCGQLPWQWFSQGVNASARALRADAQMVRSTNVPRELWVLRNIASKAVEYLLSLPVLAAFAIAYHAHVHLEILLMPLAFVMQSALLVGIGLILSPLTVLMRDLERVIRIVLRIGFYCTPVLYSLDNIDRVRHLRHFFGFNPMAGIMSLYRAAFFPQEVHWAYVIDSAIGCVVVLVIGMVVFARLERPVLKEI
jgi:ABC-2 type transport system permease protein